MTVAVAKYHHKLVTMASSTGIGSILWHLQGLGIARKQRKPLWKKLQPTMQICAFQRLFKISA